MSSTAPTGCTFLLNPVGSEPIFTPEHFTDEQRAFAQTAEEFMERDVFPHVEALEHQEDGLMVAKLKKAGELGLLMIDVPEQYGGLDLDKTTSMLCSEKLATYPGFSVSHGAHTGIGSLPLVFFGNAEQKARYLPKLATGELLAAYALTEPWSGSDALGARATAVRTTDAAGRPAWKLNGTKMWITNAGFADLFTVFAKVDGDKFTAFLVERTFPGVSTGAEERKMGIKGSSTRMLILEDVIVPDENLLYEIGKGHKIAFNILNFGRFKLGVGALGGAKRVLEIAVNYARERQQFKTPIANFGAIRQKLADMTVQLYSLEAMCYRVAGYMDAGIGALDSTAPDYASRVMDAIEEFAVEDSIMKVYGSEAASFCCDEAVQIHGGYGFSAEYEVERAYRDCRINRIFEGTNEVNRLLIPGILLKKAMKGELNLFGLVGQVEAVLAGDREAAPRPEAGSLAYEMFLVEKTKQIAIYASNLAIQKHMADLKDQQELLLVLADMLIAAYATDCTVARVKQLADDGRAREVHFALAKIVAAEAYERTLGLAGRLLPTVASGDALPAAQRALAHLTYVPQTDLVGLKRVVADFAVEHPRWSL